MVEAVNNGVSLHFLLSFARSVPDGYTTADVVQKIVIPTTNNERCRYVSLPSVRQAAVGPAKHFVSHRWAADFTRELVTLIAGHFADIALASKATAQPASIHAPCARRKQVQDAEPASSIGSSEDVSAAGVASPSGIDASVLSLPTPADSSVVPASPRSTNLQLRLPQRSQQLLQQNFHQQQGRGGAGTLSRPLSSGAASSRPPIAITTSIPPTATDSCTSPIITRPNHLASAVLPVASTRSRTLSSLSSSAGQVHSQAGPGSPSLVRSLRVRSGGMGTDQRSATAIGDAGGVRVGSQGANGRSSSVGSYPAIRVTEDGPGVDSRSPFCSAHAAKAAGEAASVGISRVAVELPGVILPSPKEDGSSGQDHGCSASDVVTAGVAATSGMTGVHGVDGRESFSGSLNPLLARPSSVRHQWPHQQFSSMCTRSGSSISICTDGAGGGRAGRSSFIRRAHGTMQQVLQTAVVASAVSDSVREHAAEASLSTRPNESTATVLEPVEVTATAVQGRSTVTGILPCPTVPIRLLSERVTRRASSSNGCHQGNKYGGGGGNGEVSLATSMLSRTSEASDAAAGDMGAVSSSSGRSGLSSSGAAGTAAATIDTVDGAVAVITNAELVERLLARFSGQEALLRDTYVWLDIFAINQHPVSEQANDLAQLREVVGASEATLLVMDQGGLVLTRIWCLYEIWQTVQQRGPEALQVLAGPLQHEELAHVWGDLEVEQAQATIPSDRDRILADIRTTTGSDQLNSYIKRALVKSACHDLETTRVAAPRTLLHGERAYRAAFLLRTAGSGAAALAAAREAADVFCGLVGHAHPVTLRALRAVAACHKDLGSARQAVGLLEQQVIPFLDEAYGVGHTESGALNELGMIYYTLGEYDNAYNMLLAALSRQLRQLQLCTATAVSSPQLAAVLMAGPCACALEAGAAWGSGSGGTAAIAVRPSLEPLSGENLATLLAALRALVTELEAVELDAAARRGMVEAPSPGAGAAVSTAAAASASGSLHVVLRRDVRSIVEMVGLSLHSLGLVQRERAHRCRSAAASSLLREARDLMEVSVILLQASSSEARGLSVMDARANLASLVMDGGEYQAAEQMLRDNLTLTERVYGKKHPHTATAANNLALCLKRQRAAWPDKAVEATSLYRRCLEICSSGLGECHPETLVVATNLGVMLADQRQWSESERLLTWAVSVLPAQVGERHPDVLAAYRRLAEVLELRSKLFEAEAMFRMTLQLAESGAPEARDHGLVLECREGLQRVQEMLETAAKGQASTGCCVVS